MASDHLSLVFSALADPTRRAILAQLAEGPKAMGEVAGTFDMTGPAVTKHLKVLEKAGLVKVDKRAQQRVRLLVADPLKEAQDWIEPYRRYWDESFERLDAYLRDLQSNKDPNHEANP